jgi:integrative and conjugative element protein (TIGR02256 family)
VTEHRFQAPDGRFKVTIQPSAMAQILAACHRTAPLETGGILIGHYTKALDHAIVTAASDAPSDSRSSHHSFQRGVHGLQRRLIRAWHHDQEFYLGEWHSHPANSPAASAMDITQMQAIAESERYHCPEPVLLIIGGELPSDRRMRAYVFSRRRSQVELLPD